MNLSGRDGDTHGGSSRMSVVLLVVVVPQNSGLLKAVAVQVKFKLYGT